MQKDITTFHLETSLEYTVKLEIPFLKRRNCVAIVKICDWPHRPLLSSFSLIFFFHLFIIKDGIFSGVDRLLHKVTQCICYCQ